MLLAGFTDSGDRHGKLWVHDKLTNQSWQTGTGSVSVVTDFYDDPNDEKDDGKVEKWLSDAESRAAGSIHDIRRTESLPRARDLDPLLQFIALLMTRHHRARFLGDGFVNFSELIVGAFTKFKKPPVLNSDERAKFAKSMSNLLVVPLAIPVQSSLARKTWTLLRARPETGGFVTSDTPVAVACRSSLQWIFVGQPDALVVVPLSARLALVGREHGRRRMLDVGPTKVCEINGHIVASARERVYAKGPWIQWFDRKGGYREMSA